MSSKRHTVSGIVQQPPSVTRVYNIKDLLAWWTVALTPSTNVAHLLQTMGIKLNCDEYSLTLYEVGVQDGLNYERQLDDEVLLQNLVWKWSQENSKKPKKLAVNTDNKRAGKRPAPREADAAVASASLPTLAFTPSVSGTGTQLPTRLSHSQIHQHTPTQQVPVRPSSGPQVIVREPANAGSGLSSGGSHTSSGGSGSYVGSGLHDSGGVIVREPANGPSAASAAAAASSVSASGSYVVREPANAGALSGRATVDYGALRGGSRGHLSSPGVPEMSSRTELSQLYEELGGLASSSPSPNSSASTGMLSLPAPRLGGMGGLGGSVGVLASPVRNSSRGTLADSWAGDAELQARQRDEDQRLLAQIAMQRQQSVGEYEQLLQRVQLQCNAVKQANTRYNPGIHVELDTFDVNAQLASVFTNNFPGVAQPSPFSMLSQLLFSTEQQAREMALRFVTHITTKPVNQLAIGGTPMTATLVQLLLDPHPPIQALAAWCVSNIVVAEVNKERMRTAHGIPPLCLLLTSADSAVVEQTLRAFTNLLKGDETNKSQFCANGGACFTIRLLRRTDLTPDAHVLGLRVLMLLTFTADVKAQLLRHDALAVIISFLSSDRDTNRKMASWVLSNLVVDGTCNDHVRVLGGVPHLVNLLQEPDPFVREQVSAILANLAVNESNLDAVRESSGLPALIKLLCQTDISENLRLKAVWALSNLLVNDENQLSFLDAGGVRPLIAMLSSPQPKIVMRTAAAFVNLTQTNDEVREALGDAGGIRGLLKVLTTYHETEMSEYALKGLVNLSLNFQNEERVLREGLFPIVQCLQRTDGRVQELALLTLANLSLNELVRNALRELNALPIVLNVLDNPTSSDAQFQCLKLLTNLLINNKNRGFFQMRGVSHKLQQLSVVIVEQRIRDVLQMASTNASFPVEKEEDQGPVNEFVKNLVEEGTLRQKGRAKAVSGGGASTGAFAERYRPQSIMVPQNVRDLSFQEQRMIAERELAELQRARNKQRVILHEEQSIEQAQRSEPVSHLSSAEKQQELEEKAKARIEKRGRIAAEMLVTERAYVDGINIMIKKYMNPMLAHAAGKKPCVSETDVKKIFSISELIFNFHSMLLGGLEVKIMAWSEETLLGDYLFRMAEFLRIYQQYVNNYDHAVALLEELEKRPAFLALLSKCTNSDDYKGQTLYNYLITPIQRPPRYEMLLAEMIRNTTPTHPDFQNLNKASLLIQEINASIDAKASKDKSRQRVLEIDRSIVGKTESLIAPHRLFTRECDAMAGPEPVHLFLLTDWLLVCKIVALQTKDRKAAPGTPAIQFSILTKMVLCECSVANASDLEFSITNKAGFSFTFKLATEMEKTSWLEQLQKDVETERRLRGDQARLALTKS